MLQRRCLDGLRRASGAEPNAALDLRRPSKKDLKREIATISFGNPLAAACDVAFEKVKISNTLKQCLIISFKKI